MPTALAKRNATPKSRAVRNGAAASGAARRTRLAKVRGALSKAGCDALLVTNAPDVRYLSGFRGDDSFALLTRAGLVIISDFRFAEELEAVRGVADVHIRAGSIFDAVKAVVGDLRPAKLGVQAEHLTLEQRHRLAAAVGPKRIHETTGILRDARAVKYEPEVAAIRRAIRVQEQALLAVLDMIEAGQTEAEVAARLEYEMKLRGAERVAFEPIVAAGANGSLPHAVPGRDKLKSGRTLLIDWGARVGGYNGDMTRTFALGRWPKPMADVYKLVLEAHEAALAAIAPGRRAKDIDSVARNIIKAGGHGGAFGHGLGHGLGLDVHESPRLGQLSDDTLKAGMVVTVEPGVYLPGVGGVRIEDDVLVTDRGAKSLCSLPKSLEWATR